MSGYPWKSIVNVDEELLTELWEQYQEAETQFGDDYFWEKHGHREFIARFREALGDTP